MNAEEFNIFYDELIKKEKAIMVGKGKEYTEGNGEVDRFFNFNQIASELNDYITALDVMYIYYRKHVGSVTSFVKSGGKTYSNESIESRLMDIRNYAALMIGLIQDMKKIPEEIKKSAGMLENSSGNLEGVTSPVDNE